MAQSERLQADAIRILTLVCSGPSSLLVVFRHLAMVPSWRGRLPARSPARLKSRSSSTSAGGGKSLLVCWRLDFGTGAVLWEFCNWQIPVSARINSWIMIRRAIAVRYSPVWVSRCRNRSKRLRGMVNCIRSSPTRGRPIFFAIETDFSREKSALAKRGSDVASSNLWLMHPRATSSAPTNLQRGRPPADTELVAWNIPRATTSMIRAECQRLGTTPGHFVSCVLLSRYFEVPSSRRNHFRSSEALSAESQTFT
jgi:hypothetical protein